MRSGSMRMRVWLSLGLTAAVLGACGPRAQKAGPPRANPILPPRGFAYDALANAENARFALRSNQTIPAVNDLDQALSAARRLKDETASLFPRAAPPPGRGKGDARLTEFGVLVLLNEARAELNLGDTARAERLLAGLEAQVPARLVPQTLPLIRARESLSLAQEAQNSGRYGAVRAQLEAARAALGPYVRGPHAAQAQALVKTLSGWLRDPGSLGRLPLYQPGVWRDHVQGWL